MKNDEVPDCKITGEVWSFDGLMLQPLFKIKVLEADYCEDEVREKTDEVMGMYFELAKILSHIKYKFVDSGLCNEIADWGVWNKKYRTEV